MPKLPSVESMGARPVPQLPSGLAQYNPANQNKPSYRQPVGSDEAVGAARARAGEVEMAIARDIGTDAATAQRRLDVAVAHEQERTDTLRAEEAFTALRNAQLDLSIGEKGYASVKGSVAVERPLLKEYGQAFDQSAADLSSGLANDNQRTLFAKRAAIARLQFDEGILRHVMQEKGVFQKEVFDGAMAVEIRNVVANPEAPLIVASSLQRINSLIAERAETNGWPADYTESVRLKEAGKIHNAVITQALANGNFKYAQGWYEAHKADIDLPTAKALETAVRDGTQKQLTANYTAMLLQGRDSPRALDELERRVTEDKTLDDTRRNALLGNIKNRIDTLQTRERIAGERAEREADRAERRAERAQTQWEKRVEKAVSDVMGRLPFGEPSMDQLGPLITATRGTPMQAEVDQLVNIANGTRAFRNAQPMQQEAYLNQLKAAARTDPTKVDAKIIPVLEGIFNQQQKMLKESPISFVVSQGFVSPDNAAAKPIDLTKPETLAALPARLDLARAVSAQYRAPTKPLTVEEKDAAVGFLATATVQQKREFFGKLAGAAGTDYPGYNAVVAQIAPDNPVTAIAGIAANRQLDDGKGKFVADLLLRGQAILNPNRKTDGTPDKGTLLPMPPEAKMRLEFDNTVRDALAGNAPARSDFFQAARAIYAAKSVDAGDKDTSILDNDRWRDSMRLAMGNIEEYNKKHTVLPWNHTIGMFRDGLNKRLNAIESAGLLPEGVTAARVRDLPVEPVGDGKYVFKSGDGILVGKTGRPVLIDFNQSMPFQTSGGPGPGSVPSPAEIAEAKKPARARVAKKPE